MRFPLGILMVTSLSGCIVGESATATAPVDDESAELPPEREPDEPPSSVFTRTLYAEGRTHSPITQQIAERLAMVRASASRSPTAFAKIGDSITDAYDYLYCFDGGPMDLGPNQSLAGTIEHYTAGKPTYTSAFARDSVAAVGGSTAGDALAGSPNRIERELATMNPELAILMFGSNDAASEVPIDEFGSNLWTIVDTLLAAGVIPIQSSIPPLHISAEADARARLFNLVIRAIAQGRGVPFVDYHRELLPLQAQGLSQDRVHPSTSPQGACDLSPSGLGYGYNTRNLITLQALARTRAALTGEVDADAPTRAGRGRVDDPVVTSLPLFDLGDTRDGEPLHATYGCQGRDTTGNAIVYAVTLPAATTMQLHVVDRGATDVDLLVLADPHDPTSCIAAGDRSVTATAGPGTVYVVVDARAPSGDGEFVVVGTAL